MALSLICEDHCIDEAVDIIKDKARTGQSNAGWIYVFDVLQSFPIEYPGWAKIMASYYGGT